MNPFYMGLTTERKVFFGLMVVAGASLILDQTILSPGSASAGSLGIDQVEQMPNQSILAGVAEPIVKSVTKILNDRLGGSGGGEGFMPVGLDMQQMFSPLIEAVPQPEVTDLGEVMQTLAVSTTPKHEIPTDMPSLSAVMPSRSGRSGAILDATLYRIGQTTANGYRLLDVEQRQVLIERNGHKYWITLPAFED